MTPLERLARLISGTDAAHSAAATLPRAAVELEVNGVGKVSLPIRAPMARRLIAAARPAHFGRGTATLQDDSVRDTWELTPDRFTVGGTTWAAELAQALQQIADELSFPRGTRLRAEPHAMLVYGKGQFFKPHQDSEKHDDMVATLVVILPSTHSGGELVIDDRGQERIYHGGSGELTLVAWYADRRHEVKPVRSGHRVTLTFNLLVDSRKTLPEAGPQAEAAQLIRDHFSTPANDPYGLRAAAVPNRLAFLLDHEYTVRGLSSGHLKGADAERVSLLRAAAAEAGCASALALAEIHETRDVIAAGGPGHYYGDDWEEESEGDIEAGDLIDDEVTLTWWQSADGSGGEEIGLGLDRTEICAVTPSRDLKPYESAYEGYMGNYGNTIDRWYRRAALVCWPRDAEFTLRAEMDPLWALQTLAATIERGDLARAGTDAASLKPIWSGLDASTLPLVLAIVRALDDPALATMLLKPYRAELLRPEHASALVALAEGYGVPWWAALLDDWASHHRHGGRDRDDWVAATLLPLAESLSASATGVLVRDRMVELVWRSLATRIVTAARQQHPQRRDDLLLGLAPLLAAVLQAGSDQLGASAVEEVRRLDSSADALSVTALRAASRPAASSRPAFSALAEDARARLARLLALPTRAIDDFSIDWSAGCGCPICNKLADFLGSSSERVLVWPLAEQGRQHVIQRIETVGLPVACSTRKEGRPYRLVLEKTKALFVDEIEARQQAETDLAWLDQTYPGS